MLKVILLVGNKDKYNITNMVTSLTWSGDENTYARQVSIEFKNTDNLNKDESLIKYTVGNMVFVYYNEQEIFRGYVFNKTIDQSGNDSFTAYDNLVYITKSNHTMLVKNKLVSEVITSLFNKVGVPIGSIQPTTHKIKKLLFQNQSLADIIRDCLDEDKKNTGKSYKLFSSRGLVYLWKREKATKITVTIDDLISGSKETSIEDTRTQVMVTKGSLDSKDSKFITHVERDTESSNKYGIMQHVEEVDDKSTKTQMIAKAKSLLNELKSPQTVSQIEFIGNIDCKTGNIIIIKDNITGIAGEYYISSDSHTFSNGNYKMSLQLSKKLA